MSVKTILVNGVKCWDLDGEILPILCGMTTLAVDAPRTYELGDVNEFPMIATDIIYEGAAVGLDGSGNARPLVAGDKFVGFAESKKDNSTGAAGALRVRVRRYGVVRLAVTGVAALTDVGALVYASDDATFTLTESTNSLIGRIIRWDASTTCYVAFNSQGGGAGGDTNLADVAAATAVALTGTNSGTANGALEAEGVLSTAGGNTYTDAAVNAVIAKIENNIAELAAVANALVADVAAIRTAVNAAI